jgi:PAS domain S-box-containing protein
MPHSLIDLAGLQVGAEDFLAAVLGATEQPIWVVDSDGVIRFANPAAISALGYERVHELVGCHSHETIHHHHPDGSPYPAEDCPMLLPRATGETVSRELDWFFRRDGSMFPVSYVSAPIELHDGRGAVVAFTDIEDRLRAEQRLREHDAALAAQQASLRRVATLAAGGAVSEDVFAAIAKEVGNVTGAPLVAVWRYGPDDTATVVGVWSEHPHRFQPGTRWPLDGPTITGRIHQTRRPVRIDDWAEVPGTIADAARDAGITAAAGVPIVVGGELWGAMSVDSTGGASMPDDVEDRLLEFTELVAAAFATTARQEELARLVEEQAALRRVATLVAQGVSAGELFAVVTEEVGRLLEVDAAATIRYEPEGVVTAVGSWSAEGVEADTEVGRQWPLAGESLAPRILRTGRPTRIDDWNEVPGPIAEYSRTKLRLSSSVGSPIVVEGRVWGNIAVHSTSGRLPSDTEARIARFTELVSTAILNAQARADVQRLADEQAALRRVAMMVAYEREAPDVFAAVAEEVGRLLPVEDAAMLRYEDEGSAMIVASWGALADVIVGGMRIAVDGDNVTSRVRDTRRPARIDDYATAGGAFGTRLRELGIGAAVGCPIVVDGQLWGAMIAAQGRDESLPADTEARVAQFTELIATAISNLQARAEVARLAEEQAALRRVATLVAEAVPPSELFNAVVEELGTLLRTDLGGMIQFEADGTVTAPATWAAEGEHPAVEGRWSLEGDRLATTILETRRPTREDDWENAEGPIAEFVRTVLGIRSSVGSPIIVEGHVWGAVFVHSKQADQPLPADTEARLTNFAELVATAISNAQARAEVGRLAEEQAALRRVATLVAEERPPPDLFAAVAKEVGRVLRLEDTRIVRYEADGTATVIASWGQLAAALPVGTRVSPEGLTASTSVFRTRQPTRIDDFTKAPGSFAASLRELGVHSAVGVPIVVDGRLWGALSTASLRPDPIPADTERRMEQFSELVATAVSNIEARSELAASRVRIVAAADEERRRVVRDLHDGAQQRLVHTVLTLKLARQALAEGDDAAPVLDEALGEAERANDELRELSHGVLPAVLARGGLLAGIEALATRAPVPVDIRVCADRLPTTVEATGYFVVAEALTNVAKHSHATRAEVTARVEDGALRVRVRDDGIGGARRDGTGLLGLADRLALLDGELRVQSPESGGTLIEADVPVPA